MKFLQIVAHTTGGEVKSSVEQVTEREYESIKDAMKQSFEYIEFNTETGWVVIPGNQIIYMEIVLQ